MLNVKLPVGLIWELADRYAPTPEDGEVRHPLASERFDIIVRTISEIQEGRQEAALRALVAQAPKSGGSKGALEDALASVREVRRDPVEDAWMRMRSY